MPVQVLVTTNGIYAAEGMRPMSLILHLTDLHLGPPKPAGFVDKMGVVPEGQAPTTLDALKRTLMGVSGWLAGQRAQLDAVVISGDISDRGAAEGFGQFDAVLGALGATRPEPGQIVVVPGNHDIARRETVPEEKYREFIEAVRSAGYVTPLIAGLDDLDAAPDDPSRHVLIAPDGAWVIVPMDNSVHYGSGLPAGQVIATALKEAAEKGVDVTKAMSALDKLTLADVPRVGQKQLDALARQIEIAKKTAGCLAQGCFPTIVVAMHHHLLPVCTDEVVAPFSSITNLGAVRSFLRQHGVQVVLHGHTHTEFVYYDSVPDYAASTLRLAHRVLVVAGCDATSSAKAAKPARLVRIAGTPHARLAQVASLSAVEGGSKFGEPMWRTFPLWGQLCEQSTWPLHEADALTVASGDMQEVYERAVSLCEHGEDSVFGLVCQVTEPTSVGCIPVDYPLIPGCSTPVERQQWFDGIVKWWQLEQTKLQHGARSLLHGRRLRRYGDGNGNEHVDQIELVAARLRQSIHTSQAVAVLLDPRTDGVGADAEFPCFCLVHFVGRQADDRHEFLDVVAYYRKQEMRYWWPVNVAELRALQVQVLDDLKATHKQLRAGAITTVAAVAEVGSQPPRVAVPLIDRLYDEKEDEWWQLIAGLARADEQASPAKRQWVQMLKDWEPSECSDPKKIPVAAEGLDEAVRWLHRLVEVVSCADGPAHEALVCLDAISAANAQLLQARREGAQNQTDRRYANWHEVLTANLAKLRVILAEPEVESRES